MIKKKVRKILGRVIRWALDEPQTTLVNWDINTSKNRFALEDIFVRGASTPAGRKVVVGAIKQAKLNREL